MNHRTESGVEDHRTLKAMAEGRDEVPKRAMGLRTGTPFGMAHTRNNQADYSSRRYSSQNAHPTFFGPGNVKLKISSGHAGFQNLELVAERAGHNVLNLGTIVAGGKSHDTVLCDVLGAGRLKNYAIRFEEIEHLITTDAPERVGDTIVSTFSVHSSSEDEARTYQAAPLENEFQLADWSFRTATLLYELFVRGGKTENDKLFLIQTGFSWIRSEVPEKILTGLNVLRFLVRSKDVQDGPEFQDEVVKIFVAGGSPGVSKIVVRPAIRLAALDLLANTRVTPNPVTKLPNAEAGELRNFRTEFMKNFNKSQYEYTEKNIDAEVRGVSLGKTYGEAMRSVASRV
jgi:hypothetical protein